MAAAGLWLLTSPGVECTMPPARLFGVADRTPLSVCWPQLHLAALALLLLLLTHIASGEDIRPVWCVRGTIRRV
jgi:hypothetical protein